MHGLLSRRDKLLRRPRTPLQIFYSPFRERGRSKRIPIRESPHAVWQWSQLLVRLIAFSFARILLTCVFTVPSLRKSVTPLKGRSANEAVW